MEHEIVYSDRIEGLSAEQLQGFFVGWPEPPSPATHLRLLQGSSHAFVAREGADGPVVGFVTAVADGVLSAYIPLLEVLPSHQGRGIGRGLVERMLERLSGLYMVDLACDAHLVPFYEGFGMVRGTAMLHRNYERQSGAAPQS